MFIALAERMAYSIIVRITKRLANSILVVLPTGQAQFAGIFLSLYKANRVISKVCLQIIFVCGWFVSVGT